MPLSGLPPGWGAAVVGGAVVGGAGGGGVGAGFVAGGAAGVVLCRGDEVADAADDPGGPAVSADSLAEALADPAETEADAEAVAGPEVPEGALGGPSEPVTVGPGAVDPVAEHAPLASTPAASRTTSA